MSGDADADRHDEFQPDLVAEEDSSVDENQETVVGGDIPSSVVFRLLAGSTRSLMSDMSDTVTKVLASSVQVQMKTIPSDFSVHAWNIMEPLNRWLREELLPVAPQYSALNKRILELFNEQFQSQMASIRTSIPAFAVPINDFPVTKGIGLSPAIEAMLKQIIGQQSAMLERLHASLKPLFDPELLRGFNRALLPPNLKAYTDEIQAHQVHEFLEQEGIPLYLVPRGRTALRLLRAQDRSARRRVLGNSYKSIIDDCAAVLERVDQKLIGDELDFALDGLGAMRAGHPRSAQAMFTVTLDTLIYRFYPDRDARRLITNRKKGESVPTAIEEMGVHEAMVWLPIWNAHEEFWKHRGDKVPHYYSRHASVHGVSTCQFSKRNCVQVLMLVTSLIGYADRSKPSGV